MQIKNREQLLGVVAVAVLALFAADKLLIEPLLGVWNARAERITKLSKQVTEGRYLIQRDPAMRSQWNQIARSALTNNTSIAEQTVFQALDSWMQDSRATINAINPQWKQDSTNYMTLQCRLDVSGDLPALTRFLYAAEKDPMALRFDSIELNAHDKTGQQLSLGLQISALVLTP